MTEDTNRKSLIKVLRIDWNTDCQEEFAPLEPDLIIRIQSYWSLKYVILKLLSRYHVTICMTKENDIYFPISAIYLTHIDEEGHSCNSYAVPAGRITQIKFQKVEKWIPYPAPSPSYNHIILDKYYVGIRLKRFKSQSKMIK